MISFCFVARVGSSADVKLAWDASSDTRVTGYTLHYGTSPGVYVTSINVGNFTTYTVKGLGPGTYYFAVSAYGASGETSVFSNEVMETVLPSDTTPPVIAAVSASGVTASAATVTWATDEASDSLVEYGTSVAYGNATALDPALVMAHSQALSGLAQGTLYHYRVKSRDAAGNVAVSADFTFTTANAYDLNGDGAVNILDLQKLVNGILGVTPCGGNCDLNGDGAVNILDLQRLINAILGGSSFP